MKSEAFADFEGIHRMFLYSRVADNCVCAAESPKHSFTVFRLQRYAKRVLRTSAQTYSTACTVRTQTDVDSGAETHMTTAHFSVVRMLKHH
jgi:hypothetical protein